MAWGGQNFIDLTGKVFGRLTVLSRGRYGARRSIYWVCKCECGVIKEISGISLREGRSKSCNCLKIENSKTALGQSNKTTEYATWNGMNGRCHNKNNKDYPNYGGRGIKVCDRWRGENGFANFFMDMGKKPTRSHTLDRWPNNDGDYDPENCQWRTHVQQNRNTRSNVWFEFNGVKKVAMEWTNIFGIKPASLRWYLKNHSFEEAYYHYNKRNSRNLFVMNIN